MRTGTLTLVAVFAVVVVASTGVLPVHLSYVTSESMEPTLSEGDGYIIIEAEPSVGDVITFSTPDGYVTHRVVGEGPNGYITRGDANPSTDQASGMKPVTDDQVLGKALTVGGYLVVIPGLGTLAKFLQAYGIPLFGVLVTLSVAGSLFGNQRTGPSVPRRDLLRVRDIVFPVLAGVSIACVAVLAVSVTTRHLTFVATAAGNGGSTFTIGESAIRQATVEVARAPFTQVVIDAQGSTVTSGQLADGTATVDLQLPAQSEPGPYTTSISVHPYPAVVPRPLVLWLHNIHPWLACVGSTAVVFGPFWIAYGLLFDGREPLHEGPSVRGEWE